MKKVLYALFLFMLFTASMKAQNKIEPQQLNTPNKPWTSLELLNDDGRFQFAIVPDRTGGHRPGVFPFGVSKINLLQPEFVVSVGDLIEGYTEDMSELDRQWTEFEGFIDQMEMPFFYVAGNHDYTNETMAKLWDEKFGVNYYHFRYKDVLFLCLNSEEGATALRNPDFGEDQVAFVEKTLKENEDVRWTLVFMHQPLWLTSTATNWKKVESLLADRKHSVFTGHLHQYALHTRNNSDYFVLASMGGGSGLRGKRYGEFDHFLWVTMTKDGPYYANILLDGVEGKSVLTIEEKERIERLSSKPTIKFEPIFIENEQVKEVEATIAMDNYTEEDHDYLISFEPNSGMMPEPSSMQVSLKAGEKKDMKLKIKLNNPQLLQPLKAKVELKAEEYQWETTANLMINKKYMLEKASTSISVDGDISEWGNLKYTSNPANGDGSFRFDIKEGENYVYVAVEVTDDDYQAGFGQSLEQDGAFLLFDARPVEKSAYNLRNMDGLMRGEWFFLAANPDQDEFGLGFKEMLPPGLDGKGKKTATGYVVEYAIPIAILDRFHGGSFKNFRFNVSVFDRDSGSAETKQGGWLPDWLENYPGSGTMFRAN